MVGDRIKTCLLQFNDGALELHGGREHQPRSSPPILQTPWPSASVRSPLPSRRRWEVTSRLWNAQQDFPQISLFSWTTATVSFCGCSLFIWVSKRGVHVRLVGRGSEGSLTSLNKSDTAEATAPKQPFLCCCSDANARFVYLPKVPMLLRYSSRTWSVHLQYLLILKKADVSGFFNRGRVLLSSPTARAAMRSDLGPFLSPQSRCSTSTAGGDYCPSLVQLQLQTFLCSNCWKTLIYAHIMKTQRARMLGLRCSSLGNFWSNYLGPDQFIGRGRRTRVCLCVCESVKPQCLEWPVDKLHPMSYVNHRRQYRPQCRPAVSNAFYPLTKRLYEYIHRTTKSEGESEAGIFHIREGQFICTDDMQGWFLSSRLCLFFFSSFSHWDPLYCRVGSCGWYCGCSPELKAGWSVAK